VATPGKHKSKDDGDAMVVVIVVGAIFLLIVLMILFAGDSKPKSPKRKGRHR